MINALVKFTIEGRYSNTLNVYLYIIYTPTVNVNWEKLMAFSLRAGSDKDVYILHFYEAYYYTL